MERQHDRWTFAYLGGDSYPACAPVEHTLREQLVRPQDQFIGQDELTEYHADGVWVRHVPSRVAGLRRVLKQRGAQSSRTVLIGRSAGARVITRLAAAPGGLNEAAALICLAYPFQPPGRAPEPDRFEHLPALRVPTLIFQGREDAWGSPDQARAYALSPTTRLHPLPCDHHTRMQPQAWCEVGRIIEAFLGR